ATIGRGFAIVDFGRFRFSGVKAWVLWLFVHLMKLVEFQNRLLVLVQWAGNYFTRNRAARLITNEELPPRPEPPPTSPPASPPPPPPERAGGRGGGGGRPRPGAGRDAKARAAARPRPPPPPAFPPADGQDRGQGQVRLVNGPPGPGDASKDRHIPPLQLAQQV